MKFMRLIFTAIFVTVLALPATAHFAVQKTAKTQMLEMTDRGPDSDLSHDIAQEKVAPSISKMPTANCTLTSMVCAHFVASEFDAINFAGQLLPIKNNAQKAHLAGNALHKEIFHPPRN